MQLTYRGGPNQVQAGVAVGVACREGTAGKREQTAEYSASTRSPKAQRIGEHVEMLTAEPVQRHRGERQPCHMVGGQVAKGE